MGRGNGGGEGASHMMNNSREGRNQWFARTEELKWHLKDWLDAIDAIDPFENQVATEEKMINNKFLNCMSSLSGVSEGDRTKSMATGRGNIDFVERVRPTVSCDNMNREFRSQAMRMPVTEESRRQIEQFYGINSDRLEDYLAENNMEKDERSHDQARIVQTRRPPKLFCTRAVAPPVLQFTSEFVPSPPFEVGATDNETIEERIDVCTQSRTNVPDNAELVKVFRSQLIPAQSGGESEKQQLVQFNDTQTGDAKNSPGNIISESENEMVEPAGIVQIERPSKLLFTRAGMPSVLESATRLGTNSSSETSSQHAETENCNWKNIVTKDGKCEQAVTTHLSHNKEQDALSTMPESTYSPTPSSNMVNLISALDQYKPTVSASTNFEYEMALDTETTAVTSSPLFCESDAPMSLQDGKPVKSTVRNPRVIRDFPVPKENAVPALLTSQRDGAQLLVGKSPKGNAQKSTAALVFEENGSSNAIVIYNPPPNIDSTDEHVSSCTSEEMLEKKKLKGKEIVFDCEVTSEHLQIQAAIGGETSVRRLEGSSHTHVEKVGSGKAVVGKKKSSLKRKRNCAGNVNEEDALLCRDLLLAPNQQPGSNCSIFGNIDVKDCSKTFPDEVLATAAVERALREYAALRRHFVQEGEQGKPLQRPDLRAASVMRDRKRTVNCVDKKGNLLGIVGKVPGVPVGKQFYFRQELSMVGLHRQSQAGIDFLPAKKNRFNAMIAVAVIASGGYEDDVDEGEWFDYTGQGGNNYKTDKKQSSDQELVRGNLALKNSCDLQIPIRVIRGSKEPNSDSGTVYTYDGLYAVESWRETLGDSGHRVFKFRLVRLSGQPPLFSSLVEFVRTSLKGNMRTSERKGVVMHDLSHGLEAIPICCTNTVDDPPIPPPPFKYINKLAYPNSILPSNDQEGCSCRNGCSRVSTCECAALNMGTMPYTRNGQLVELVPAVFECGPYCGCAKDKQACPNRVTQNGIRFRLEVFKTTQKGWGLRSWDAIPAGSFICEYTGIVYNDEDAEALKGKDEYLFNLDLVKGSRDRWGDVSDLLGVKGQPISALQEFEEAKFCVDANDSGNVARFMNHSCAPNVVTQCIFNDHHDMRLPRIAFFAADNIPPLRELTYDYNYKIDSVLDEHGNIVNKKCHCGSPGCKKWLY